jgi:tetratricopeptide (TPR) repeat protein
VHLSLSDHYRAQNDEEKSFEELKLAFGNPALDIDRKIRILLQYYSFTESKPEVRQKAYVLNEIVVKVHASDAKAWSMYGDYLYRDKRYEEARSAFRKVIALDSSKYVVWEQLLAIESELGDYPSMLIESGRAMALFPEQADPYLYNGYANMKTGQYATAIRSLNNGLSFAGENEQVKFCNSLGDAYYKNRNFEESFDSYDRVLRLDPKNTYALNNYSYYLALQKKHLERAAEMASKLNELSPDNATYEDTYAWVLFMQGKYSDARIWLDKALAHGGNSNAAILEHYGDVLFKLNDPAGALRYWEQSKAAGNKSETLQKKINDKTWHE